MLFHASVLSPGWKTLSSACTCGSNSSPNSSGMEWRSSLKSARLCCRWSRYFLNLDACCRTCMAGSGICMLSCASHLASWISSSTLQVGQIQSGSSNSARHSDHSALVWMYDTVAHAYTHWNCSHQEGQKKGKCLICSEATYNPVYTRTSEVFNQQCM